MALAQGVEMPAIHVALQKDGGMRICDGRHRLLAHKLLGKKQVRVRFKPRMEERP